ncbi:SulP family inorganic anion transporter [Mycolicibacterium fortuitum]|uniref:SulP family inorganic anion transporter n=1 Tax=Mycolicibacterium fortuitum TaxID=1766 RepID=UPI002637874C|nr:SulP family inorganic anion transporter [Mycolicibacterium fortuitum]
MIGVARDSLARLLPGRADYAGLGRSWRRDVLAGLTVGVVALPLALAFGISSGVGAAAGLVTAVVAGVVAAVFGGSHVQVSGPTGAMAVVLAPIVTHYGLGSVALVTVLAGLIVVIAGVTGLGRAVTFIPWPVIEGFTLGIAIIIFLQQVPSALGQPVPQGKSPLLAAATVVSHATWAAAWPALLVVVVVVALMLALPRLHPAIPASLLAVIAATILVAAVGLRASSIGALPSSLPAPVWPHADLTVLHTLFGAALAIAALAAIESLLSARVAATMSATGPYDPNRELVGQGLASVASGVFGGMPATGAIARTAVNVRSGARTRVAAIVHSLLLLAVVYLVSGPVGAIPLAALSAVLMVTSFRMISRHTVMRILRSSRSGAATFLLTAAVTVGFDLIQAVEIGIAATALFVLRTLARRSSVVREDLPGPALPGDEQIAVLRLDGAMFFGAAERISASIIDAHHPDTTVVIIRLSQLGMLDATGAHTLAQIAEDLEKRGITVIIKGVRPEHRDLLTNVGIIESLRHENHLIDTLDEAIAHARTHTRPTTTIDPPWGRRTSRLDAAHDVNDKRNGPTDA